MSGRYLPVNPMTRWSNLQPYLSGLLSIDAVIEGKQASSYYPAHVDDWPKAITRQWYRYNDGIPDYHWTLSDPEDPLNKKLKSVLAQATELSQAGCFTGKMRHIVQKLHGAGRTIPFTHVATSSDGIFIPPGDKPEHEKQRWVIMVRRDGIYTAPIRFVKERVPEHTPTQDLVRYDYHMLGAWAEKTVTTNDPAELGYKNKNIVRLRIGSESMMDAIFSQDKQPLIARYGWAFNYTGSAAQIVLLDTSGDCCQTYHYQLTFSMANGIPACEGVTLLDSGPFYTGSVHSKPLRIPTLGDVSTAIGYSSSSPPLEYNDTPVYVFFDQGDMAVVLKHSFKPAYTPDDETTDTRGNTYGTIWESRPCREGASGTTDAYNQGMYQRIQYGSVSLNSFTCDRTLSESHASYSNAIYRAEYTKDAYGEATENSFCWETAYIQWNLMQAVADCFLTETHESHTYLWSDIIGWAFAEAEGFFHYRQCEHIKYEKTINNWQSSIVYGYATQFGPFIRYDHSTYPPTRTEVGGISGTSGTASFGLVSSTIIPQEVEWTQTYVFSGSVLQAGKPLTAPTPGIMETEDQIYEAALGTYSGQYILLPWPRNSYVASCDYPFMDVPAFGEGPLIYPNFYWIGDETTGSGT